MKIILWLFLCVVGIGAAATELGYVKYFAGEPLGTAVLLDGGVPTPHQIEVTESDLPLRLNLSMYGRRKTIDIVFNSLVTLTLDGPQDCGGTSFEAGIDTDGDLSETSIGFDKLTLRSGEVPNKVQSSQLMQCQTAGLWTLGASVADERGFEMQRIEAELRGNSRAINWLVAGVGLGVGLFAFIMLIPAVRQKYPHLAT
ncbi:hypothetical protein [Litoreibacter halocynthiae]|uniref:hypothetical protein n=1 Tax=Litoreibacter halocynthiae TaxID=1242689 RepID=UPI00248FF609|nr:hypothetical protein [Litoreibacter halocynthiae]